MLKFCYNIQTDMHENVRKTQTVAAYPSSLRARTHKEYITTQTTIRSDFLNCIIKAGCYESGLVHCTGALKCVIETYSGF